MLDAAAPIIAVQDVTIAYGDYVVLRNVNCQVKRGEVFVILGGSGCGKSTLLKAMIGLIKPVTGRITIEDHDIVSARGKARSDILRSFGVTFQSGALFGSMNLLENICLPLEEFTSLPASAIELIARMKLEQVGLTGFEYHMPSELSGGMRKRAAIARAMALDPKILFLDEPSAGLDPITSAELDALILRLAGALKMTFVVVTHELPSVFSIADDVIMLDKRSKGVVAAGTPIDLRDHSTNEWVRQFFNRQTAAESGR